MSVPSVTARVVAIAVVAAVTLSMTPAPATSAPTSAESTYGSKLFQKVNNVRANHDRVKLKKNKCLQGFANRQAEKIAKAKPKSSAALAKYHLNPGKVQARCNVGYVAENLAFGPYTAKQTVKAWMNSKYHRVNILFRKYRITGVAARKSGGYWWASQVFGRKS